MEKVYFISHPEVRIDNSIPVTQWDLSSKGLERLGKLLEKPWINDLSSVYSSNEQKARTAARRIAERRSLPVTYMDKLGEMDRSSTGFLEPTEFEVTADAFFANPNINVRGWESAVDAQRRIVQAVEIILEKNTDGNIAIVSHGGVGSLLMSHLKGTPISRSEDQPGQGHYFVFERSTTRLIHSWRSIS